jgi:hypothetical protein
MQVTIDACRRRIGSCAAMMVAGALVFAPSALAATAPIYKCVDASLGLIYTDQQCKGGEQIDIHPGDADPAAAARLAKARDDIDRRASARLVEERRAAAQKEFTEASRREREAAPAPDVTAYDSDVQTWYPAYLPARAGHPRANTLPRHTAAPRGFAPHGPFVVPRS